MKNKKWKVKYFKNLHYFVYGICLYWIKEIHIDLKFKGTKIGKLILEHELIHKRFFDLLFITKNPIKQSLIGFINNLWDFFDDLYIKTNIFYNSLIKLYTKILKKFTDYEN